MKMALFSFKLSKSFADFTAVLICFPLGFPIRIESSKENEKHGKYLKNFIFHFYL